MYLLINEKFTYGKEHTANFYRNTLRRELSNFL